MRLRGAHHITDFPHFGQIARQRHGDRIALGFPTRLLSGRHLATRVRVARQLGNVLLPGLQIAVRIHHLLHLAALPRGNALGVDIVAVPVGLAGVAGQTTVADEELEKEPQVDGNDHQKDTARDRKRPRTLTPLSL